MRGTKQVGIWSEMRSFWQPHPTQDQPAPPEGFEIDSRIGAAAPRAPTVSKEDSRPQAILKFRPPSSLDYKARHGPQTNCSPVNYSLLGARLSKLSSRSKMHIFTNVIYKEVSLKIELSMSFSFLNFFSLLAGISALSHTIEISKNCTSIIWTSLKYA